MQEMFNRILSNYLIANKEPFQYNKEAVFIRQEAKSIIENEARLDLAKYLIMGSAG